MQIKSLAQGHNILMQPRFNRRSLYVENYILPTLRGIAHKITHFHFHMTNMLFTCKNADISLSFDQIFHTTFSSGLSV